MKIIYINTNTLDFLTATLIEGLQSLGHQVLCSEASNYGHPQPESTLMQQAATADLVVLGSNMGVNHALFARLPNANRAYVDGSDFAHLDVPPNLGVRTVFKRELNRMARIDANARIFALPFAAEKRYFPVGPVEKDIALSFIASMQTNPLRTSIHERIQGMRGAGTIFSGSTGERSYDYNVTVPIPTPRYREILLRSRIGINVPGMGYDCARYWEILAAGAMLLTWEPDIRIPDPFTDGVDCATFRSVDEFADKASFYLDRPELVRQIATRGTEHLLKHHTTAARAAYFLSRALG